MWDAIHKTYLSYNNKRKKLKYRESGCNYESMQKAFLSYQKTKKNQKVGKEIIEKADQIFVTTLISSPKNCSK